MLLECGRWQRRIEGDTKRGVDLGLGTRLARRRASDYELVDQRSYVDIAQGAAVRSRRHREVGDDRARCWVLEDERCGESCASELLQPRGEAHRLLRLDTRLHERHVGIDAAHARRWCCQVEMGRSARRGWRYG